ncbi:MAG: hypothetical protein HC878_17225 [Leptolyngbyaceae cyanobacterium SL_5_14]|nr:hypothetical protein [Leptolyngbyaceae cyanobacterium SL_5_14]
MNSRRGERPFALTGGTGTGKSSLYSATPQILWLLENETLLAAGEAERCDGAIL